MSFMARPPGGAGQLAALINGDTLVTIANGSNVFAFAVSASVTGGAAPYTYAWSDDSANVTLGTPSASGTSVFCTGADNVTEGTIFLQVTDSIGDVVTEERPFVIQQGTAP